MVSSATRIDGVLSHVRAYTDLGVHILLIHGVVDGKCTCGNEKCSNPGKHPLFANGVYGATADYEWLTETFHINPQANLAFAAGRASGILMLDLDTQDSIDAVRRQGIPETWKFLTGKGEQHAFKYPKLHEDYYIQNAVQLAPGMDIRSDGGYSIVPPSIHYSGKTYQWVNSPEDYELAPIPEWLMAMLIIKNKSTTSAPREDESSHIQTEGGRNDYLFKVGTSMRAARFSGEEIRLVLLERNMRSCEPPLPDDEVNAIVASIVQRYNPGIQSDVTEQVREKLGDVDKLPPLLLTAPMTDSGNAECLVELFAKDFRACKPLAREKTSSRGVFRWDGHIWTEDTQRDFRTCAMWTARGRKAISAHAETVELRKRLYKFGSDSENLGKLEAMCELASTNDKVHIVESLWDCDPLKLTVQNGTIDLETGSFYESKREDYITKIAPVEFEEAAECPLWEKTLSEIFRDNLEIIPYLQRVFGYSLTGLTDEHLMWFWYGGGANGKSTILNTIKALLGDLAATTSFSTFDTKNDNGRNDGLAELRGMRFVAASEGEQGRAIAEAKIKSVISNDEVSCRFLFNNLFSYKPTYKVILASNHLPEIKGTDKGIWRRVHIVPFNQTFEGDARDLRLEEKLLTELPGILNWCLKGLADFWSLGGFDPPTVVLYTTKSLEVKSDLLQQWMDERLTPNVGNNLRKSTAYLDYRNYLRTSGESPINKLAWTSRLEEIGVVFSNKVRGDYAAPGWRLDSEIY